MTRMLVAVFALFLALGLSSGDAEAARLGGGKSVGMQRQSVSPKPATPAQQATPATPAAPAAAPAPAATPKRNWLGPIAGLAAGLGIAALLSHFGLGEGMANFLMIALLVMAVVFIFRLIFRRPAAATQPDSMQYAGAGNQGSAGMPAFRQEPVSSGSSQASESVARIPEGFDAEGFLRVAKLNFVRLQASHDAGNINDIREFVSPGLYAEIRMQIEERGKASQQTDIVTLNAELLEVVTEGGYYIASVNFSGMIREMAGAAAEPFGEIWNLSKPIDGHSGWVVAGIQQIG